MPQADDARAGAELDLRETGILPLASLPWGAHISLFYATGQDLIDAVSGFLRAGLAANEYCVWIVPGELGRDRALAGLRAAIPGFDDWLAAGAIELIAEQELDRSHSEKALRPRLDAALSRGCAGMRISGTSSWLEDRRWPTFRQYEEELADLFADRPVIALSTYKLTSSQAGDLLDVAQFYRFSIIRRDGKWELLETPQVAARRAAAGPGGPHDLSPGTFAGADRLSPRERATLAEIVKGASSKQAARTLGISPRTVEFHRANLMRKLGAANLAELLGIVHGAG